MKNIAYMIVSIIVIVLLIPLLILKGVGSGIKAGGATSESTLNISAGSKAGDAKSIEVQQDNIKNIESRGDTLNNLVFDDKNGGGPKIKVYITEKNKLEEMYLEEYVRGVLGGEMPAEFQLEALKSQAVAARTYAVTKMKIYGGQGCSNHKEADICTDSTHCQEWISKEDRIKEWSPIEASKLWDKLTEAVDKTKGMVLTYNSVPVMYPLYFSTSSGKTENSEDIFVSKEPYLRSVVSSYEEGTPKFVEKVTFKNQELVKKFSESSYKIKLDVNKLSTLIKITERTEGGSVKSIKVGTKTLTGMEVRGVLELNSANFKIDFSKSEVAFTTLGYGHGVGLSQYGANGLAKQGKKYDEILKYYYQGTDLSKIDEIYKSK